MDILFYFQGLIFVSPKYVLAISCLPETVHRIVNFICSNITCDWYCHNEYFSVSTHISACNEGCDTCNFSTTFVFLLTWHGSTNATHTPTRFSRRQHTLSSSNFWHSPCCNFHLIEALPEENLFAL